MRDKSLKAKSVKRSSTKCIRKSRRRSNNFVTLRPLKRKVISERSLLLLKGNVYTEKTLKILVVEFQKY